MPRFLVSVIALSAVATSLVTPQATAGAAVRGPGGFLCGYAPVTDPNPDADATEEPGEVKGGPAITDRPGTLICTIQVGAPAHDGPDAAVREFTSDPNGVIAGVETISYAADDDPVEYLCTMFRTADGTMIYWTGGDNARWHTDPSKRCSEVVRSGPDSWEVVDGMDPWEVVEGEICRALAARATTGIRGSTHIDIEGDVFVDANGDGIHENAWDSSDAMADLFYDCPVYTFLQYPDSDQYHDAATNGWATNEVIDGAAAAVCSDGADNDGDGDVDYPLDPGCTSTDDNTENDDSTDCSPTASAVVACVTPGDVIMSQPVALVSLPPTTSHAVIGYVGRFVFTLPRDIEVILPCVVVTLDGSADLCTAAGGRRDGPPVATLIDTTVSEYTVVPGEAIATVRVCNATLRATVLGFGVNSAPVVALC